MQPYAFPYLGYFQLIQAVDRFVLYDDVSFPKQGWVNRNYLGTGRGRLRFTFPIKKPTSDQKIVELALHERERNRRRFLKTVTTVYANAPHFETAYSVVEEATRCAGVGLADFVGHSIGVLTRYLSIGTPISRSSEEFGQIEETSVNRVIQICLAAGADVYVNAENGMDIYEAAHFQRFGLELRFLIHSPRPYPQNHKTFLPRLSIIDVMMFNNLERIAELLHEYRLVGGPEERC